GEAALRCKQETDETVQRLLDTKKSINYESVSLNPKYFKVAERDLATKYDSIFSGGWKERAKEQVASIPAILNVIKDLYGLSYSCDVAARFVELRARLGVRYCDSPKEKTSEFRQTIVGATSFLKAGKYLGKIGVLEVRTQTRENQVTAVSVAHAGNRSFVCINDGAGVCKSRENNGLTLVIDSVDSFQILNSDGDSQAFTRIIDLKEGRYEFVLSNMDRQTAGQRKGKQYSFWFSTDKTGRKVLNMEGPALDSGRFYAQFLPSQINTYNGITYPTQSLQLADETTLIFKSFDRAWLTYTKPIVPSLAEGIYAIVETDPEKFMDLSVKSLNDDPFEFELNSVNKDIPFKLSFVCDERLKCVAKREGEHHFIVRLSGGEKWGAEFSLVGEKTMRYRWSGRLK
ncbi:MAG: hypothetical protein HY537_03790, partial [Deltaproteobacteria bacterium]|nr:hypothetical protein [Deltaproteobacteria bacterium]